MAGGHPFFYPLLPDGHAGEKDYWIISYLAGESDPL
jgi:hypothetical protein